MSMKNPIYVEWYSNSYAEDKFDKKFCYKIDNPWTRLAKHTVVLGNVEEDFENIKKSAKKVMQRWFEEAIMENIKNEQDSN